jgi:hypothetical protein
MTLKSDEALALLQKWKAQKMPVRVVLARKHDHVDVNGIVRQIQGTSLHISGPREDLRVDVQGAAFNGYHGSPGYLACEFPNGDKCFFYHIGTLV